MDLILRQISLLENDNITDNIGNNKKEEKANESKFKVIRKDNHIMFRNINCEKLKYNNERAKGIKDLCYEIQHLSINGLYKSFPIAYCFLIRSLLEQKSIYFLVNKGKWYEWKKSNNNKDLRLGKESKKFQKVKQI